MNIKVKYLNWDKDKENQELLISYILGNVLEINDKNYRTISEYEEDYINVDFTLLETIFEEHNRIDDEHFCRLTDDQRSMCAGDLIFINDLAYVVKNVGFERII